MDLTLRYFFKVIGTPIKRLALALIFEEECALKRVFFFATSVTQIGVYFWAL